MTDFTSMLLFLKGEGELTFQRKLAKELKKLTPEKAERFKTLLDCSKQDWPEDNITGRSWFKDESTPEDYQTLVGFVWAALTKIKLWEYGLVAHRANNTRETGGMLAILMTVEMDKVAQEQASEGSTKET